MISAAIHANLRQQARNVLGEFTLSRDWMSAGSCAAALLTEKGNIYTGICIDVSCGIGFCAEHAAAAEMLKARETRVVAMVAVAEHGIVQPCGRCRELIFEIDRHNLAAEVQVTESQIVLLRDLLPHPWL